MFERFTDRARRVVVLAQEEARALGHNYIGTEHLLLGLVGEGEGVAAKALERLGVDHPRLRAQILERVGPRGTPPTAGNIPFTPRAKRVLELSLREALELGHNYIGTEHVLLGMVREGAGLAAQVLVEDRGVQLGAVRRTVVDLLQGYRPSAEAAPRREPAPAAGGPHTPAAATALASARARAGRRPLGTQDLLVALCEARDSAAARALAEAGVDVEALRGALERLSTAGTSDETPEEALARRATVRTHGDRLLVEIEDPDLVGRLRDAAGDAPVGLSGDDPRVAHELGELWRTVGERLTGAAGRLHETTGQDAAAGDEHGGATGGGDPADPTDGADEGDGPGEAR